VCVSPQVSEEVSVHTGGPNAVSAAHQGPGRDAVLLPGRVHSVQRWRPLSAACQSCGQLHAAVSHGAESRSNPLTRSDPDRFTDRFCFCHCVLTAVNLRLKPFSSAGRGSAL